MRSRVLSVVVLVTAVSLCLTACSNPLNKFLHKDSDDEVATESEVATETNDTSTVEESENGVVSEGSSVNVYLSNVGNLSDPYSGILGVGSTVVDHSQTYSAFVSILSSDYKQIYASVDGVDTLSIDDTSVVPMQGVFRAAFAPEGVTNTSDPKVINVEFGVPYDPESNNKRLNVNKVPISDYVLTGVSFYIHDTSSEETGVGLSVPEYRSSVLTKDDAVAAFGGSNGEYLTADASDIITFAKPDTVYSNISFDINGGNFITRANFEYDVNFGIDVSALGSNVTYGVFEAYYKELASGQYYGCTGDPNDPSMFLIADAGDVNVDTGEAYYAQLLVNSGGTAKQLSDVSSSVDDGMPIKARADGVIYCASANMVVKLIVDFDAASVYVGQQCRYEVDDAGNTLYFMAGSDGNEIQVDSSADFDALLDEYNRADPVIFTAV